MKKPKGLVFTMDWGGPLYRDDQPVPETEVTYFVCEPKWEDGDGLFPSQWVADPEKPIEEFVVAKQAEDFLRALESQGAT